MLIRFYSILLGADIKPIKSPSRSIPCRWTHNLRHRPHPDPVISSTAHLPEAFPEVVSEHTGSSPQPPLPCTGLPVSRPAFPPVIQPQGCFAPREQQARGASRMSCSPICYVAIRLHKHTSQTHGTHTSHISYHAHITYFTQHTNKPHLTHTLTIPHTYHKTHTETYPTHRAWVYVVHVRSPLGVFKRGNLTKLAFNFAIVFFPFHRLCSCLSLIILTIIHVLFSF